MFAPLAWVVLVACWVAAGVSFLKSRQRRQLLDTRDGLQSLTAISWRSSRCWSAKPSAARVRIEETGLGGADGGIDLVLRKDGRRTLVQCKQWKRQRVDVRTVREMYGLLAHHGADAVKIVSTGDYTPDAARFADGKPIELITGDQLLRLVEAVKQAPAAKAAAVESSAPQGSASQTAPPRRALSAAARW